MARPREFDETAVLDAAVLCFWTRGYEATSIRDLAEKMEITGASLYNAFGDKRSLYLSALAHYVEHSFSERAARLEKQLPPREAIRAFFNEVIECSLNDPQHKGCMLVNSALEAMPDDPEIRQFTAGFFTGVEAFFHRCVAAGQREKTITASQPAEDLARLLVGVLLGVRVLARANPDRELLEGLLRPVFALLDIHPTEYKRIAHD